MSGNSKPDGKKARSLSPLERMTLEHKIALLEEELAALKARVAAVHKREDLRCDQLELLARRISELEACQKQ